MKRSLPTMMLLLVTAVGATGPALAAPQDDRSRDRRALADEQLSLQRQIKRLREKIVKLAPRYEAEQRPGAAALLRQALEFLDERPTDADGRTIEELMNNSSEDLEGNRVLAALERQERIIGRVARLLDILTERDRQESIEEDLQQIREIRAELNAIASEEQDIREDTEALREDATTPEQREVLDRIDGAIEEQQRLLRANEERSRASGLLDAERLLSELKALEAEQRARAADLRAANAGDRALLESMRPSLAAARSDEARAADLDRAAAALEEASRGASPATATPEAAAEAAAELVLFSDVMLVVLVMSVY
jgi:hypothetical protein